MGNLGYGAYPTHPGEVLKDEIEERGISQRQLAESMGLTYSVVNEILNARRPLTAKTALMFEAALDVSPNKIQHANCPKRLFLNGCIKGHKKGGGYAIKQNCHHMESNYGSALFFRARLLLPNY